MQERPLFSAGQLEFYGGHRHSATVNAPQIITITRNGTVFAVDVTQDDDTGCWYRRFWQKGFATWEPRTFDFFDEFIRPDRSVIDIGGWVGPTILYAAVKAKTVYGVEPDPVALAALQCNIRANPQFRNIIIIAAALGDRDSTCAFGGQGELGRSESTMLVGDPDYGKATLSRTGTLAGDTQWRSGDIVIVPMVTIATLERQYGLEDVNIVKIDIEGGEKIVIPAIADFLRKRRPMLYLSLHWMSLSEDDVREILNILARIYPFIYSDDLRERLLPAEILCKQSGTVVCMMEMSKRDTFFSRLESRVKRFIGPTVRKLLHHRRGDVVLRG